MEIAMSHQEIFRNKLLNSKDLKLRYFNKKFEESAEIFISLLEKFYAVKYRFIKLGLERGGGANFQVVDYSFSEFWSNCFVLSVLSNKQT